MNIIIAGVGEVGRYIAETIVADAHDVTVIDADAAKAQDCRANWTPMSYAAAPLLCRC